VPEHLVVVCEVAREPERDRREPRCLRREIESRGVGTTDDHCELAERGIGQAIVLHERVEAAAHALVRNVNVGNVVRRRFALLGRREHFLRRHVDEFRLGIDQATDQPRACDAVDLRPLARHPARARSRGFRVERAAFRFPGFDSALQILRRDAALDERG